MKKATLGTRKHREYEPKQRYVNFKCRDINVANFGWSHSEGVGSTFSVSVESADLDVRIELTKEQVQRAVNLWKEKL